MTLFLMEDQLYEPLRSSDSIRLFTIHPRKKEKTITAIMLQADIRSRTCYEGLSYTWDNVAKSAPILVNGHTIGMQLNLWKFVVQLWRRYTRKTIWVDAVCINQTDLSGKARWVQNDW